MDGQMDAVWVQGSLVWTVWTVPWEVPIKTGGVEAVPVCEGHAEEIPTCQWGLLLWRDLEA